ncbi:MAG: helix-turn-helix domain-containing protein [Lentisphaeria bacterium]|nr:helix-turn-helix domain-containing protein [Lentisphaeria bacterium]MBR7127741.1 helix-turn-helix domain-containing protein [Lentisphaeria bacterium]
MSETENFNKLSELYKTESIYRRYSEKNLRCGIGFISFPPGYGNKIDDIPHNYTFAYILSGQTYVVDENGKKKLLRAGDVFQRYPGVIHSTEIVSTHNYLEMFFYLDKSIYEMMRDNEMPALLQRTWEAGVHAEYPQMGLELKERLRYATLDEIHVIIGQILAMINQIYFNARKNTLNQGRYINKIEEAIRIITDNARSAINIAHVAETVGLGFDTFRKEFKKFTGQSPNAFLIKARIHIACELLKRKEYSIKEISAKLGYPDPYSFSKQFKQIMGESPSEFNKR